MPINVLLQHMLFDSYKKEEYLMPTDTLKLQIELQEPNYRSAIQLQKDYETLRHIRDNIRELKETLASLHVEDENH